MKKQIIGIGFGVVAGILDIIPMIIQRLTWDANISAFTMWVIVGFLISSVELKINSAFKGVVIAFMVLFPSAILIGWKEPNSLVPIGIMTTVLGALLGFLISKITDKKD